MRGLLQLNMDLLFLKGRPFLKGWFPVRSDVSRAVAVQELSKGPWLDRGYRTLTIDGCPLNTGFCIWLIPAIPIYIDLGDLSRGFHSV